MKTYLNDDNETTTFRNFGNKNNARYIVRIEKEKIIEYEFDEEDETEDDEGKEKIYYKLLEFTIYDKLNLTMIYDKNNFEVIKNDITEDELVAQHEYEILSDKIIKKDIQKSEAIRFIKDFKMTKNIEEIIDNRKQKEQKKEEIKNERTQLTFNFDYLNDPLNHECNIKVFNKVS